MIFTKLGKIVAWITIGVGFVAVFASIPYVYTADIPDAYISNLLGSLMIKGGAIIIIGIALGIFAEISKSTAQKFSEEGS